MEMNLPTGETMSEGSAIPPETENEQESQAETSEIPASLLDGQTVAAGDTITLKVVSVDESTGNVTVTSAGSDGTMSSPGSDAAASEFDQTPQSL